MNEPDKKIFIPNYLKLRKEKNGLYLATNPNLELFFLNEVAGEFLVSVNGIDDFNKLLKKFCLQYEDSIDKEAPSQDLTNLVATLLEDQLIK